MSRIAENTGNTDVRARLSVFVNLPTLLSSLGAAPEPVLRRCGFRLEQFTDPDQKVSYRQLSSLLAASVNATGCEHFGLLLGQSASSSLIGIAGTFLRFAPDVGSALSAMVNSFALQDEGGVPMLLIHPEVTLLGYSLKHPEVMAVEQIHDLVTAIAYKLMLELCGPNWRPSEVLLLRRRPPDTKPYKRFFASTIIFDADVSAVAFPTRLLAQALPSTDEFLFRRTTRELAYLNQIENLDLIDVLRQHLRQSLLHRECSASAIAHALGMNERTLQRRLLAEGTSYRQELDTVRRDVSLLLLSFTSMSLADVAECLCYTHSSTFTRAFSRWIGMTPSDWRSQKSLALGSTANSY